MSALPDKGELARAIIETYIDVMQNAADPAARMHAADRLERALMSADFAARAGAAAVAADAVDAQRFGVNRDIVAHTLHGA